MNLKKIKGRRSALQDALLAQAKGYALEMAGKLERCSVILYGSVVRGDFNSRSDIDIIVISDSLPTDLGKRNDVLFETKFSNIEPKGYRKAEFESLKNKANFREMLRHSIVLTQT